MSVADVDEVARGRVWSGEDALDNGLVDQLGGLTTAIAKAKELAEIDAETQVRIVSYPMSMGSFPLFSSSAGASAQELRALGQLASAAHPVAARHAAVRGGHEDLDGHLVHRPVMRLPRAEPHLRTIHGL